MIIDAHHHLWTADYPWLAAPGLESIRRDYTVADLVPRLDEAGVTATLLVEAGRCDAAETAEFLALAAATARIAGVVGWASLTDPAIAATLAGYRDLPGATKLVGIRDQVQGVVDPGHLARPDVRAALVAIGAAGLTVDLVVHVGQLPACAEAARATPGTTFVLDHLGKPRIAATGLAEWRTAVRDLAGCDNVVAKLSGLLTEAGPGWRVADIRPYVDTALELFGPHRLMAGSDWPVCDLVASYAEAWAALDACLGELSPDERTAVLAGTAIRTYALEVGS
ncbi:amidohydrolase family protein [Micromonospora sp. LH3U1]|uniref:amidohydrolase family protein n=1 Tax=Micromonospora sp. LH3U1 TaxID=3018339 RepID=UPI00234AE969|nr:amidohydrolase family protein [Micromonospora sp. LH3U1]WCN79363.1 amidohydrolase family protein [Micromonospora sp. LH3U1]